MLKGVIPDRMKVGDNTLYADDTKIRVAGRLDGR